MPFVKIFLRKGKSPEYLRSVADAVHGALVAQANVPADDRFQVITEHAEDGLLADRNYLGIRRTKDCIFIQLTLNEGRTLDQKRAFYKAVADGLHQRLDVRREDVLINLVEVKKENWSFGNGEAQYAQ